MQLGQHKQTAKKRFKDPNQYSILLNDILVRQQFFRQPYTTALVVIEGAINIILALLTMHFSVIEDVQIHNSEVTDVRSLVDGARETLINNQVIIQLVILFVLLLIVGLHFLDISCKSRDNKPFLTVVNRHVISLFVLLIMTAGSPILCFLIIQGFFLTDERDSMDRWRSAVSIAAASVNFLLFISFGIFLPRLYLNKTTFIKNPLERVPSLYPFFQVIQRIMFQLAVVSALQGETFTRGSLVFLVPLAFVASFFSVSFKAFKFASYSVSNLFGALFDVTVTKILLVTTLFQGYIFSNDIDFTRLVLYSVLLTIGYALGFFILNSYIMDRRWHQLLTNKEMTEEQLVQSLIKAQQKLKTLAKKGPNPTTLKDLLYMLVSHSKKCKDVDCMCKMYYKIVGLAQSGQDLLSDESAQPIIAMYQGTDQGGILSGYLTKFVLLLTRKGLEQYPHSLRLANIGLELLPAITPKSILEAQYILINLNTRGFSFLEKIQLHQLEMLVDQRCQTHVRTQGEQLAPKNLMDHHFLQSDLQETLGSLISQVQRFWLVLQQEHFNVSQAQDQQNDVAKILIQVLSLLKKIEASGQDLIHTYFTYSILHRLMFHDSYTSGLYLKKLQTITDIKKIFNKRHSMDSGDVSFMVIESSLSKLGKIKLANKKLHHTLGFKNGELNKNQSIDICIPKAIRNWHNSYMQEQMETGQAGESFSDKGLNGYVTNKEGYITLINLQVRLIFTTEFGFVYIAYLNEIKNQQIGTEIVTEDYTMKDAIVFLCDEDDYKVLDISEGCKQFFGLDVEYLSSYELGTEKECLSLFDLFGDCESLERFAQNKTLETLEEKIDVDQNVVQYLLHNLRSRVFETVRAKLVLKRRIIKQSYKRQQRNAYIIAQLYVDQTLEDSQMISMQPLSLNDSTNRHDLLSVGHRGQSDQQEHLSSSQDSTHTKSSITAHSPENLKQFLNSTSMMAQTSKGLKLVLQLVLVVFAMMFGISVLNLALIIERHVKQAVEIEIVKKSFDRLTHFSKVRVLTRSIINIANGYEEMTSQYTDDIFNITAMHIVDEIRLLQVLQDDLNEVDNQNVFGFDQGETMATVKTLDVNNEIQSQDLTFSSAYQLFLSKTLELMGKPIEDYRGRTEVQLVKPIPNIIPTDNERLVTFVHQNSIGDLSVLNWVSANRFADQSMENATSVTNQKLITIVVSIIVIWIVALAITPIIARFQQRRFESLTFFMELTQEQIEEILQQCEAFQLEVDNEQKESKLFKKKKSKTQNETQGETPDIKMPKPTLQESNMSLYSLDEFQTKSRQPNSCTIKEEDKESESDNNPNSKQKSHSRNSAQVVNSIATKMQSQSKRGKMETSNRSQRHDDSDSDNQGNSDKGRKEGTDNQTRNAANKKTEKVGDQQIIKEKLAQVELAKRRVKTLTIVTLSLVALFLSMYFIGTYILTLTTFQQVPDILHDLEVIFFKDSCIENGIAYVRENQFQNRTLMMDPRETSSGKEEVGSTYTLNMCIDLEHDYRLMKRDLPQYFKDIEGYMEYVEGELCPILDELGADIGQSNCWTIYSGAMRLGFSRGVALVLSTYIATDQEYLSEMNRDMDWIEDQAKDMKVIEMMEVYEFLLFHISAALKQRAMESVISHFYLQRIAYVVVFCVFTVLMAIILVVFLMYPQKQMKFQSVLTNQAFKILPLDLISSQDLGRLRQFCQA